MKIVEKIIDVRKLLLQAKMQNKKIAFVPTMGALHDGHLSLVEEAKKFADFVVVSIFINKAQFNDLSDYEKYPRNFEADLEKLKEKNVDAVFLPQDEEIYPDENYFEIKPKKLTDCLCGASRKGHFDGVALVVSKLFNIVKPDFAVFGKKDFQQFVVIKKLVENFNFDIEIVGVETVREVSGLAMSSRNQRLSVDEKKIAANIFRILNEIKNEVKKLQNIENILQNKKEELLKIGFEKIDYLEIRDEEKLELIDDFNDQKKYRIFVALYLHKVRLIDNLKI